MAAVGQMLPAGRSVALLGARELALCGLDGMGAVAIRAQPTGHQMRGRTRAVLWEVCVCVYLPSGAWLVGRGPPVLSVCTFCAAVGLQGCSRREPM